MRFLNYAFLIKEIKIDSTEDRAENAVKYEPIGYVQCKEAAEMFCKKGRDFTGKDCWAIQCKLPQYSYEEIKQINFLLPRQGGCWFCNVFDDTLYFDMEFDTNVHKECVRKALGEDPEHPEAKHMKYILDKE